MTNQDKVHVRLRYMMQHGIKVMSYLYHEENRFNRAFGAKTEDLKQQYPLDAQAINYIEQEFLRITHRWFKLNTQELGAMKMTRNAADAVIPDDTRSL